MDIPRIYHVYTSSDIPWIYKDIHGISFMDIHGISLDIPCISTTLDIPCIYIIWNRDRLYEIMDFGTYMYVPVCTEYIPVRNAENGTYMYVPVCTEFVQVL